MEPQPNPTPNKTPQSFGFFDLSGATINARMAMAMEFAKTKRLHEPHSEADYLSINGGIAIYGGAASPYNRVYGFGGQKTYLEDIARIESFYWPKLTSFEIELAPLAAPEAREVLQTRKYLPTQTRQIWALPIGEDLTETCDHSPETIISLTPNHQKAWVAYLDQAFGQPMSWDAVATFETYSKMPSVQKFVALDEDKPAGAGALFLRDRTAILFSAGIELAFRGKGLYRELVCSRLQYAQAFGADLAIAETVAGSKTSKNLANMGFQMICALSLYSRQRETF